MRALFVICCLSIIVMAVSCQDERQMDYNRYYSAGALVYQMHCQNCHGDKGQGLAALIPPLTDSLYLKTNKHLLACYLQNGLQGTLLVNKRKFASQMPATSLSPIEIAQVLTYVNNSFGNKNGLISSDEIATDIKACK